MVAQLHVDAHPRTARDAGVLTDATLSLYVGGSVVGAKPKAAIEPICPPRVRGA